jgi:hypothetical protein
VPIQKVAVPSEHLVLPSQAAIHKLKCADFCKLSEAEHSNSFILDESSMMLTQGPDSNHSFITSSVIKDKAIVIKSKDLTWEQLTEAAICMLEAMKDQEWLDDHIKMHITFWSAL